jgi:hypothetical protein
MNRAGLVFGLLDTTKAFTKPEVAEKYRDFTLSWARYGYHELILEAATVNDILNSAVAREYEHCLILSYGLIVRESWSPDDAVSGDLCAKVDSLLTGTDFLIAADRDPDGNGLDSSLLLVNLRRYQELGAPDFGPQGSEFVRLSTAQGLDVPALGSLLEGRCLRLPADGGLAAQLDLLQRGDLALDAPSEASDYLPAEAEFLRILDLQTRNARRAAFLWNIESYEDIERAPQEFTGPVSSLYSVAAGFKPNRILETHGFDEQTRVVFFDYSNNALDIRKRILEEWDGADYPGFVQQLFEWFPYPETYYFLWNDLTPDQVDAQSLDSAWQAELERWGGESRFARHWRRYRDLQHEFVHCNLLTDPTALLDQLRNELNAIIWWSNAFFTMYGNWTYSMAERKKAYERWTERLAAAAPGLFLIGSDYTNTCVNEVQAGQYIFQYRRQGSNFLEPCRMFGTEIRM